MVTAPPSEANSAEAIFTSDGKIEVNKLSALSRLSDGIVGIVGSFRDLNWFDALQWWRCGCYEITKCCAEWDWPVGTKSPDSLQRVILMWQPCHLTEINQSITTGFLSFHVLTYVVSQWFSQIGQPVFPTHVLGSSLPRRDWTSWHLRLEGVC